MGSFFSVVRNLLLILILGWTTSLLVTVNLLERFADGQIYLSSHEDTRGRRAGEKGVSFQRD